MVALLLILTIIAFIATDWFITKVRNRGQCKAAFSPQVFYNAELGVTMADGGVVKVDPPKEGDSQ